MKAKELAEKLMEYPYFDVECLFADTSGASADDVFIDYRSIDVIGIADIGYSDRVIVLDGVDKR
jgi:hypothetical protein